MRAGQIDGFVMPWLAEFCADRPFVRGAYRVGSSAELAPDAEIDGCSDIDVMLVTDGADAREKPGKLAVNGHVIEATYLPWDAIRDPEKSLADYHIAHGLHLRHVLMDRDGALSALCRRVAEEFPKPERVRSRVNGVLAKIENGLNGFPVDGKPYARLMSLAFNAGIMAHAALVAARKNPTVRMRYRAAKGALTALGEDAAYEDMLRVAGFSDITATEAREFIRETGRLFDEVAPKRRTHFFFTSDLAPEMRASAVDDLIALADAGQPRETMFWVCATRARLMQQADADAPEIYRLALPAFGRLADRIGVGSPAAELERIEDIRAALPALRALTERVIRKTV